MAEKKRHHYIPQLYLKYFSKDKKNITVFSIKEKRIVTKNAPIDRQCYQNYMYGKNQKFENVMSLLEGDTKRIFEKIISSKKVPRKKDSDYALLLVFILLQSARTLFAAEQLNDVVDKTTKSILKDNVKFGKPKGITTEYINKITFSFKESALYSLGITSQIIPLLLDLDCKLIINKTSNEFITSDNPVIRYNKYYLNDIGGYTGFACKGLLILFPITPGHYLIYYDPIIYKIGGKKLHKPITQLNEHDVDELNILQLINSNKTVYTLNMGEKYFKNIFTTKIQSYRFSEKSILKESEYLDHGDGKKSKFIYTIRPSIKYVSTISFIKISKKIPDYYKRQNLVRSPILIDLYREFCEKVKRKQYKYIEWCRFLDEKKHSSI